MKIVPLEQISSQAFARVVKTSFRVWIATDDSLELELDEITPPHVFSAGGSPSLTYESFALMFLGPVNPLLPQRIYEFESAALGRFELFIVPVSRDHSGTRYQATFNRLVKNDLPRI